MFEVFDLKVKPLEWPYIYINFIMLIGLEMKPVLSFEDGDSGKEGISNHLEALFKY